MTNMKEIDLPGLVGSSPLGALAAFGLLRVCNEIEKFQGCKLKWTLRSDWTATLLVPQQLNVEDLVEAVSGYACARENEEFTWDKDIRVSPERFKSLLIKYAQESTSDSRLCADFFCAFGSEAITDNTAFLVKPTAFYMTSGQQKFLDSVKALLGVLKETSKEAITEVLFGPWLYKDNQHALGWDPCAERMHALRHRAPTSEKPMSVRGAIWLAVEALPFFPTVTRFNKLVTTGFSVKKRESVFTWPIWSMPIGIDTLKSLLASKELHYSNKNYEALHQRGISAVYQSIRSEFGQGYAIFRPASVLFYSQ